MVLLLRLWPVWLVLLAGGGLWWVRRDRRRRNQAPPARETITSPGPARLPRPAVVTAPVPAPAVEPTEPEQAAGDLDTGAWRLLWQVVNGKGEGLYANLLAQDGRFRMRSGPRFTLYRCSTEVNGVKQAVCIIVRIGQLGHITARRIICGQDRPLVLFVDEARIESADDPKDIAYGQATNSDVQGMQSMATLAVLALADELVTAARCANLTSKAD